MKKPKIYYAYNNEKLLVPEQYIYQLQESKGGGFEIGADFYTYAFEKHGISIIGYETLYGNQNNMQPGAKDKNEKANVPAGIVYFAVSCTGKDKKGIIKTGVGEVGNESINNFQRTFPYGMAAKRAKVDMGKEFLGLTNVKMATYCVDFSCPGPQYKGQKLGDIYKRDPNFVKRIADDNFDCEGRTDNEVLHFKCKELIKVIEDFKAQKEQDKKPPVAV